MILYSMIYVEREPLHPDVREMLWVRASGAGQFKASYKGYPGGSYYEMLEKTPCTPNPSVSTIRADQPRIFFDLNTPKLSHNCHADQAKYLNQKQMQRRFADVMISYHKRNQAFIYNQSQSEILIRILEVVFSRETAFWLYSILIETILPLNFYTNTLYPQAFLDYTMKLIRREDQQFFEKSGDAINFFCLKSYYSLFTNLTVDSDSEAEQERRSEMAYFMLDILFLLGDPKTSTTMMDDSREEGDGLFLVGEAIPVACLSKSAKLAQKEYPEPRVRLDRTSQLLLAMSITIADFVKQYYLRADKSKSSDIDVKIS